MNNLSRRLFWLDKSIAVGIGLVFLIAGISKLLDIDSFAVLIDSYGLTPNAWSKPIAVLLPGLEVIAAVGLFFNKKWALHSIGLLTLLFIAILSYGIGMGLHVDCGCFGVDDPEFKAYSGLQSALIKDLILLAGVVFLYVRNGWNPIPGLARQ